VPPNIKFLKIFLKGLNMIILPVIWASFDFRPYKRLKIYFQNFYIVFKIKKYENKFKKQYKNSENKF